MQKKFISNLALVLLLNLLIKPFYILGIDAEILKETELANPGSYGAYFSLLGLTFVCNIFLDLGIINFNTRNIAKHSQLLSKHFSGIFTLRLILGIGYLILLFLIGLLLNYNGDQLKILGLLGVNQIFVAFILYFRSNLAGLLRFREDSILSIMDRLLLIGICSVLLWGGITEQHFKIEWFIYAQTIAYGTTALLGLALVLRQTGRIKLKWESAFALLILKKSMPFALLILLMSVYYYSDAVMLERIHPNGELEAASYAQGYRFFMAANMIGYLFAGLLLPLFSRMLQENKRIEDLLFLSLKLIFGISVVIGLTGYCFKSEIINWRYGSVGASLTHASNAFGFLMLSFIAICTTYIFGTLLTAKGALKALNIMAACGVTINIALNLILIPDTGSEGAALASLITQVITAIAQVYLAFKIMKLQIKKTELIALGSFILLSASIFLWEPYISFHWIPSLLISLGALLSFSMITGMISMKNIYGIIKNNT